MTQRPLRILCFGDSLTGGYTQLGLHYQPYRYALATSLNTAFPGAQFEIETSGQDGDVTRNYELRLDAAFRKKSDDHPYDWTIILGGTNDLALRRTPEAIFEDLERAWSVALRRKSAVLALTVPDIGTPHRSPMLTELATRRSQLNTLILGYTQERFHTLDLQVAFSYDAMPDADRKRFWDDGVHFTADGYDRMGELVAAALVSLLKNEQAAAEEVRSAARLRRPKRIFKDDDKDFVEEESGDDLHRGYIVVRRKDLD